MSNSSAKWVSVGKEKAVKTPVLKIPCVWTIIQGQQLAQICPVLLVAIVFQPNSASTLFVVLSATDSLNLIMTQSHEQKQTLIAKA